MSCAAVWFKRDLRLADHAPLAAAIRSGRPLLLFYCVEPELLADPHYSARHWRFVWQSLADMRAALARRGQRLEVLRGDPRHFLARLTRRGELAALYSHEETGLALTYDRDRAIAATLGAAGVPWHEFPSNGVTRGRRDRRGWSRAWRATLTAPQVHKQVGPVSPAHHAVARRA